MGYTSLHYHVSSPREKHLNTNFRCQVEHKNPTVLVSRLIFSQNFILFYYSWRCWGWEFTNCIPALYPAKLCLSGALVGISLARGGRRNSLVASWLHPVQLLLASCPCQLPLATLFINPGSGNSFQKHLDPLLEFSNIHTNSLMGIPSEVNSSPSSEVRVPSLQGLSSGPSHQHTLGSITTPPFGKSELPPICSFLISPIFFSPSLKDYSCFLQEAIS
jgi:hypothetical protein